MAKRFTDTEKWKDPWYCGLTEAEKIFWSFLLDTCNMAGIWQANWPLVKFYIPSFEFKPERFGDRIQILGPEKWFIPKFIKFQYGELHPTNRLHQRILFELEKEGVSTPLKYPSQGVKDKDKDMDKEKESLEGKGVEKETRTDVQRVVLCFKRAQGIDLNDKAWDKVYFSRFSKPAKELLELFGGDWKAAGRCIQSIYEDFKAKNLTVTLETIIKHAGEWRKDRAEEDAKYGVLPVSGNGNRAAYTATDRQPA